MELVKNEPSLSFSGIYILQWWRKKKWFTVFIFLIGRGASVKLEGTRHLSFHRQNHCWSEPCLSVSACQRRGNVNWQCDSYLWQFWMWCSLWQCTALMWPTSLCSLCRDQWNPQNSQRKSPELTQANLDGSSNLVWIAGVHLKDETQLQFYSCFTWILNVVCRFVRPYVYANISKLNKHHYFWEVLFQWKDEKPLHVATKKTTIVIFVFWIKPDLLNALRNSPLVCSRPGRNDFKTGL